MPSLQIDYPSVSVGNRIVDAFCIRYAYSATIPDPANPNGTLPNPEGKPAFTKRMIALLVREVVREVEESQAAITAKAAVVAPVIT